MRARRTRSWRSREAGETEPSSPRASVTATLAFDLCLDADPVAAVNVLRRTALVVTSVDAMRGSLVARVEAESAEVLAAAAAVLAACPLVRDLGTAEA